MVQDMDLVRAWARRYYELGFNPLPSRGDAKRPALKRFKEYLHGKRIPSSWLSSWWAPRNGKFQNSRKFLALQGVA
jgi:hypothetical protein